MNSNNSLTNLYLDHSWQNNKSTATEVTELLLNKKDIVRGSRKQQGFIKQQTDFFSDFISFL